MVWINFHSEKKQHGTMQTSLTDDQQLFWIKSLLSIMQSWVHRLTNLLYLASFPGGQGL